MARKTAAVKSSSFAPSAKAASKGVASKVASTTPVRNSAIPKVTAAAVAAAPKKEISRELIAIRAFEISMGGSGGAELENWLRAERELRAGV